MTAASAPRGPGPRAAQRAAAVERSRCLLACCLSAARPACRPAGRRVISLRSGFPAPPAALPASWRGPGPPGSVRPRADVRGLPAALRWASERRTRVTVCRRLRRPVDGAGLDRRRRVRGHHLRRADPQPGDVRYGVRRARRRPGRWLAAAARPRPGLPRHDQAPGPGPRAGHRTGRLRGRCWLLGATITRGPFLPLASCCTWSPPPAAARGRWPPWPPRSALLARQGVILHLTGRGAGRRGRRRPGPDHLLDVGYSVQQRRSYVARLRHRPRTDAVTAERLRIARELHDVVAHSMTVVTVQAGFGEYVFDSQPAEARAALAAIQTVSRRGAGRHAADAGALRQPEADAAPRTRPGRDPADAGGRHGRGGGRPAEVAESGPARDRRPRPGPRWRPRRDWPAWTGWCSAPPGPASRSGLAHRDRPAAARRARPVRVPHCAGGADQRGQALRRGPLPGAARLRACRPAYRGHRPRRGEPAAVGARRRPAVPR